MEINAPKISQESLTVRNNYYVVEDGGVFHYFPIKPVLETLELPVIRLEKRPPVLLEGIIYLERKPYYVPIQDLLRGIVRKTNILSKGRVNARNQRAVAPDSSRAIQESDPIEPLSSPSVVSDPGQRDLNESVELEVAEAANAAWEEQALSLLNALHSEEGGEWEITQAV